ncbi:MAG TPA: hypothetical protein VFE58_09235 [Tepidisphaeraceae bacterium]|nr:hypothetical protein [Tepidisphaeraceae bacterium]
MKRFALLVAMAAITLPESANFADILHLKDGQIIEGDVKKDDSNWIVTLANGQTTTVSSDNVRSIEAGASDDSNASLAGLASLRRSAAEQSDAQQVVDRYNRFIVQYPGTAASDQAKQDIIVWQDRLNRDLVRVGKSWVTKQDRGRIQQDGLQFADRARQQMKDGRVKEAEGLIAQALSLDPQNATALYLRALLAYQSGQFVAARKDLEIVKSLAPNHAPTLNNLAVLTARQNRFGESISYFEQAMKAAPLNRMVLDNVAEAFHALADESQRSSVQRALAQRVSALFQEQDARLQQLLQAQGLHRWGATWVNDTDFAKLKGIQKQIDEKLGQIQAEYNATQQQIAGINQQIAGDESSLRQMESDSYRQDIVTGRVVIVPLPPVYSDVQRDVQIQQQNARLAQSKLEGLRADAKNIQHQLPIPQYTGALQMIGVDGAPILLSALTDNDGRATKPSDPSTGS